ncbi:MAG: nuclear transport factor 2 family protein [Chitinophaga rupis]
MHRTFSILLLLIPFTGFTQSSDSTLVSQLNRSWIASYVTRDTATMEKILAEDFIMIGPRGNKLSRMDVIHNVGATNITSVATIDSATVRVFGNTALVVAYTHFSITSQGQTMNGSNCYSDLYVKRKGVWKAVGAHVTVLEMK